MAETTPVYSYKDLVPLFKLLSCDKVTVTGDGWSEEMNSRDYIRRYGINALFDRYCVDTMDVDGDSMCTISRLDYDTPRYQIKVKIELGSFQRSGYGYGATLRPVPKLHADDPKSTQILAIQNAMVRDLSFSPQSREDYELMYLIARQMQSYGLIDMNPGLSSLIWTSFTRSRIDYTTPGSKRKFLKFTGFSEAQYRALTAMRMIYVTGSCMAFVGGQPPVGQTEDSYLATYATADIDILVTTSQPDNFSRQVSECVEKMGFSPNRLIRMNKRRYQYTIPNGRRVDFYMQRASSVWEHHVAPARMYLNQGAFKAAPSAVKAYQTGVIDDIRYVPSTKQTAVDILMKYRRRGYVCPAFQDILAEMTEPAGEEIIHPPPSLIMRSDPVIKSPRPVVGPSQPVLKMSSDPVVEKVTEKVSDGNASSEKDLSSKSLPEKDVGEIDIAIKFKRPIAFELAPVERVRFELVADKSISTDFEMDSQGTPLAVRMIDTHFEFSHRGLVLFRVGNTLTFSV